jgi:serine/threonine-protein kinase RsbW
VAELAELIDDITATMKKAAYPSRDVFGVRMALEEAGVNAIKHGHRGDPTKRVWIAYQVTPEQVLLEVEDEGPGFDPSQVPDPLAEENLERSSGRGLHLMRCYMDWLRFNDRGNRLTLCKRRSGNA